ncbi:MAG: metallophosphoesterase family protein [Spirochaetes bacterium]|nr:metallophosphoesterase family protein [Spirochaetota bacterium]MBN2769243.1 metallophosphoesterase family protein [Spirochaetota bacterium]
MRKRHIFKRLDKIFNHSQNIEITDKDKYVVFSDLHIGNKKRNDDFLYNGEEFTRILRHYYADNYKLVLNGDIEELMRFRLSSIRKAWPEIFLMFEKFEKNDRLYRIAGNHDYLFRTKLYRKVKAREGLVLSCNGKRIFFLHGHQTNCLYAKTYSILKFILRYIARPLNIRNYTVAFNNRKKFHIEKLLYEYAKIRKIAILIGHTHRPLFESLSKRDTLKYQIENLCRQYSKAPKAKRPEIAGKIKELHTELQKVVNRQKSTNSPGSLYDMDNLVPCLFNCGSGIGRTGITGLEINNGKIALVHWLNKKQSKRIVTSEEKDMKAVKGCKYARVLLKEDDLDYIFTRIELLS